MRPPRVAASLLIAVALTGCGAATHGQTSSGAATTGLPPGHQGVRVILSWTNALRKGDVDGAASYFALPSVVQNGTPPIILRTREEAVIFNRSLPCGARLVRAQPRGVFIAATFRLTERPGGSCGSGVGALARTAFVIRRGKIVQWRRLPNSSGGTPAPSGPIV